MSREEKQQQQYSERKMIAQRNATQPQDTCLLEFSLVLGRQGWWWRDYLSVRSPRQRGSSARGQGRCARVRQLGEQRGLGVGWGLMMRGQRRGDGLVAIVGVRLGEGEGRLEPLLAAEAAAAAAQVVVRDTRRRRIYRWLAPTHTTTTAGGTGGEGLGPKTRPRTTTTTTEPPNHGGRVRV